MSAREQLDALYAQWRSLTQAEAEAIRLAAWEQLEQHQAAKAKLQPLMTQAFAELRLEMPSHFAERESIDTAIRATVDDLIQLEKNNSTLLAAKRQAAEVQKTDLERTSRNLRQIQRSYIGMLPRAHWQSYS